jgi:hypothetical protein
VWREGYGAERADHVPPCHAADEHQRSGDELLARVLRRRGNVAVPVKGGMDGGVKLCAHMDMEVYMEA